MEEGSKIKTDLEKSVRINSKDITIQVSRNFKAEFLLADKLYTLFSRQLIENQNLTE